MAKNGRPGGFHFKHDLPALMAPGTLCERKSLFSCMTCTARSPLCHISHGETFLLLNIENCIMTGTTIFVHLLLGYMVSMAEYHFATVFWCIDHIPYADGITVTLQQQKANGDKERYTKFHRMISSAEFTLFWYACSFADVFFSSLDLLFLPPVPHWLKVGQWGMSECCQINMHEKKGSKTA
jgi:hypothetical protein